MMKNLILIVALTQSICYGKDKSISNINPILNITDSIQELPHIFFDGNDTLIRWINHGSLQELSSAKSTDFAHATKKLAISLNLPIVEALESSKSYPSTDYTFHNIDHWLAISDIHGQYSLFVDLLQRHGVIDSANNWIFGKAHLIINGDIFDRGTGVTEALWLVYKLQQQAQSAGGKVHYLMGNHELMVLDNDVRYVHTKYQGIAKILGKTYEEQFGRESFFGQWIRKQPITIKINDTWFVHAGISPAIIQENLHPAQINALFRDSIFVQKRADYRANPVLNLLATSNGPLWYRGYFKDDLVQSADITNILQHWNAKNMVIGHTSQKEITPLFNNQVLVIDSSIKNGKNGEVLIYNNGQLFRGLLDGQQIAL
ncbi:MULTISPECIES: metallophosphoesterase [Sphingobacterium]|uniref:Metallophosphoesterase n=1 Tax=Sphingobacterium populi TaxID=1812824 RepID=A0ABW5UDH8_9SPHI|nr:metallophosphoesterase [Sphingobacterium sp. CFCC 11742]